MSHSSEVGFNPAEFTARREAEDNPEISDAEHIRESARNVRFQLLETDWERIKRGIDSAIPKSTQILTSGAANWIGPVGFVKMNIEAVSGTTFAGQELTALGRLNHVILQGLNAYAHVAGLVEREWTAAGAAYGVSWVLDAVQYYPPIISALRDLSQRAHMEGLSENLEQEVNALEGQKKQKSVD